MPGKQRGPDPLPFRHAPQHRAFRITSDEFFVMACEHPARNQRIDSNLRAERTLLVLGHDLVAQQAKNLEHQPALGGHALREVDAGGEAGSVLAREHLALKKPGTGIPARELERVIGRRLRQARPADHLLSDEDLGDA